MTGERYKLPKGWVWTNLGEICTKAQYGWTTSANFNGKGIKLLRTTDISSGNINWSKVPFSTKEPENPRKYLLNKEDILVSRAGSVGISIKIEDCPKAIFASYLIRFRPISPISSKFISLYFKSPYYWNSIADNTAGIAIPNVNATKLQKLEIPLPPLDEQKRIVQRIEILLGHLNKIRQELAKIPPLIKKFRQSVLAKAFTGELTEEWRGQQESLESASALLACIREERKQKLGKKYKEPEPIDISSLPELPGEWEWTRTKEIGEVVTGSTPKTQVSEYWNGNIVWLTPKDLGRNNSKYISDSKRKITQKGYKTCSTKLIPKNSIVLSTRAPIGHVSVVQVNFCTNQGCKSIIPDKEIYSDYLYYLLLHNRKHLQSLGSGTTFSELAKDKLENFLVPLPCFIEEPQIVKRIEALFARADSIEKAVQSTQLCCKRLTQSILVKAFRGELVEQYPDDEPASILLEKIKAKKRRMIIQSRVGSDA